MTVTIWPLPALDVHLNEIEIAYSEYVANMRMADVERYRRKNVADLAPRDDERSNHLLGVLGEHAFAKWLGVVRPMDGRFGLCPSCQCYVGTVNTFKRGGDVGSYQVRTRSFINSPLIVREDDKDEDVFVLVVAHTAGDRVLPSGVFLPDVSFGRPRRIERFWIKGWIYGADAKMLEWRRDPGARGAAYFVPQLNLREIISLPLDSRMNEGVDADGQPTTASAAPWAGDAEQARRPSGATDRTEGPRDPDPRTQIEEGKE